MSTVKKILFSLVILYSPYLLVANQNEKPIKIHLCFEKDPPIEEQWVYWFYTYENQRELLDSFYYESSLREHNLQTMKERIPSTHELVFSKTKRSIRLKIIPGDSVTVRVYIHAKKGLVWEVTGSEVDKESNNYINSLIKHGVKLRGYRDSLRISTDSAVRAKLQDSINYWQHYIKTKQITLEYLKISQTPEMVRDLLLFIEDEYFGPSFDSILDIQKKRFPNDPFIQHWRDGSQKKPAPATMQSQQNLIKYREIFGGPIPKKQQPPLSQEEQAKIDSIKPLSLGDVVNDFSLKGLNGQVRLYEAKTPYVLIDFWATWCGPCMMEFPNVYENAQQNSELVSVLAISLDVNETTWANFAKQHSASYFRHVFCGSDGLEAKKMNKMFGVKAIPANVLLDADRRIIAVNLRGEALKQKIEELKKKYEKK